MSKKFTKKELREFDRLTWLTNSHSQMDRIKGRLELNKFLEMHGKEKCDAMFEFLMRGIK